MKKNAGADQAEGDAAGNGKVRDRARGDGHEKSFRGGRGEPENPSTEGGPGALSLY